MRISAGPSARANNNDAAGPARFIALHEQRHRALVPPKPKHDVLMTEMPTRHDTLPPFFRRLKGDSTNGEVL
jgi:hypothetical protein